MDNKNKPVSEMTKYEEMVMHFMSNINRNYGYHTFKDMATDSCNMADAVFEELEKRNVQINDKQ